MNEARRFAEEGIVAKVLCVQKVKFIHQFCDS